jgi:DNA-binding NtrC family response regulator
MKILITDDDENVRRSLASFFALRDIETAQAATYGEGLASARSGGLDAAMLDVRLADRDGLELLKELRAASPDLPVIMISGHADIRTALEAVRLGALDFLEKPVDQGRLEALISSLKDRSLLKRRVESLEETWLGEHIAGRESRPMSQAIQMAKKAARSRLCVLIRGASGSGKELFARYLHLASPRSNAPMVSVNCAAIPAELFESELFGHKKGAFTGALADRPGYFQAADSGSLFLDEIGELPLPLQSKLLRALEYGEIRRVGATETEKVDVRLIAATNRNLEEGIASGRFREDLYFRLAQVTLALPSLEERRQDIPALAEHFLASISGSRPGRRFSDEALDYLGSREWKGNVRELKNLVERSAWLCDSDPIRAEDLMDLDPGRAPEAQAARDASPPAGEACAEGGERNGTDGGMLELGPWPVGPLKEAREEFDRRYIAAALSAHSGSVSRTAKALALLPNNLSRELRALGLRRKE